MIRYFTVILFIVMIVMNYLSNALPLNNKTTGQLSDSLPNLFVPAGVTFSIWGVDMHRYNSKRHSSAGYCPLTDWHFSVLSRLGETGLPTSYMKYLIDRLTGLEVSSQLVESVTLWTFVAALTLSLVLNIRDFRRKARLSHGS